MDIKTKYDLGQFVYTIRKCGSEKFVTCGLCGGTGNVVINGKERTCPDCYGIGGNNEWVPEKWRVLERSHIGKVEVALYTDATKGKNRTVYMINSTGIGSGTLWDEDHVFLSDQEAQDECVKRNEEETN